MPKFLSSESESWASLEPTMSTDGTELLWCFAALIIILLLVLTYQVHKVQLLKCMHDDDRQNDPIVLYNVVMPNGPFPMWFACDCLGLKLQKCILFSIEWIRELSERCGLLPHWRSITLTTTQHCLEIDLWHLINGSFPRFNTIIETIWEPREN